MEPPETPSNPESESRARRAGRRADARTGLVLRIEHELSRRIIGQAEAVACVLRSVRRAAAGLAGEHGPRAALLFVGATGTGKTALARALALGLGGARKLVRVDCSEFGAGHESSKLLGAPPGYVGHEHGGILSERLAAAGECVVLFDEVEKAHVRLHELLLQVLDEGRLTDGRGKTLDFRRAFVILTSNAGTSELRALRSRLGFERAGASDERTTVMQALESRFAPEFLGRLDEIVLFRELDERDRVRVAEKALLELALKVRAGSKRVRFSPAVARWAAELGASSPLGVRAVLHGIRREIEAPLAEALLAARDEEWIEVSIRRGRPHFAHAA